MKLLSLLNERDLPTALYPIRGFLHFLHHPQKHAGPIFYSLIKVLGSSLVALVPLYKYGYDIQRNILFQSYEFLFLEGGKKPLTRTTALLITASSMLLCLVETSAITLQLGTYFLGNIRNRLFDSVLKEKNGLPDSNASSESLALISEQVGGSPVVLDKDMKPHYAFLSPTNIMIVSSQRDDDAWRIYLLKYSVFIMTLPLNIIPVVGPIGFISIQALFRGGMAHQRYFQLYRWTPVQRQRRIERHFWEYHRFGLIATALEMIPFAGYVFMYTNEVG